MESRDTVVSADPPASTGGSGPDRTTTDLTFPDMCHIALRPMTMQDIRLAVGEGELSASDVLAGCNAKLLRRGQLVSPLVHAHTAGLECHAVWRRAIANAIAAIGVLADRWRKSRRADEREAGDALYQVIDMNWDAREPAPVSYCEALTSGARLLSTVRVALSSKRP